MENLGLIKGLSNQEYQLKQGVSSSGLIRFIEKSPKHYKSFIERDHEPTKAMVLGSALHAAILEPRAFNDRYVNRPEGLSFATKEGKLWRDANKDKAILTFDEYQICRGIYKSVFNDDVTKVIFSNGEAEQSFFWEDKESKVICKCRPDWLIEKPTSEQYETLAGILPETAQNLINQNTSFVIDIKSTEDASAKGFINSLNRYSYDIPSVFYTMGMCEYLQKEDVLFLFLMIEKYPPYCPVLYLAGKETSVRSHGKISNALRGLAWCQDNNFWPGYSHGQILDSDYFLQRS